MQDNPLVIECFDFNSNGNHVLIGLLFQFSLSYNVSCFIYFRLVILAGSYILNLQFVVDSKLQKSVADLEKLQKEKIGANFIFPSSRNRAHDKVFVSYLEIVFSYTLHVPDAQKPWYLSMYRF